MACHPSPFSLSLWPQGTQNNILGVMGSLLVEPRSLFSGLLSPRHDSRPMARQSLWQGKVLPKEHLETMVAKIRKKTSQLISICGSIQLIRPGTGLFNHIILTKDINGAQHNLSVASQHPHGKSFLEKICCFLAMLPSTSAMDSLAKLASVAGHKFVPQRSYFKIIMISLF